jgi:hypothetical protein
MEQQALLCCWVGSNEHVHAKPPKQTCPRLSSAAFFPLLQKAGLSEVAAPVVAFQGMHGAYSEAVALQAVPGCQLRPCEHFETAFQVCALQTRMLHCLYALRVRLLGACLYSEACRMLFLM